MIKTVQIEQRRMICDICEQTYSILHSPAQNIVDGWVNIQVNAVKSIDICPSCAANKLAIIDWDKYKSNVLNN